MLFINIFYILYIILMIVDVGFVIERSSTSETSVQSTEGKIFMSRVYIFYSYNFYS